MNPVAVGLMGVGGLLKLFGKNKKAKYTPKLSPEDLKRRNAWLGQLQQKMRQPNLANQQFGANLGMLNRLYRPRAGAANAMQTVRPNPYLGMFGQNG